MFKAPKSKYLVPYDGSFRVADAPTDPGKGKWRSKRRLQKALKKLDRLQKALYADDRHAVLLIFQAMDAAGKDSTIRAVMEGINPAGCQVFSFKKPTSRAPGKYSSRACAAAPRTGHRDRSRSTARVRP